jgi:hypothetical protein
MEPSRDSSLKVRDQYWCASRARYPPRRRPRSQRARAPSATIPRRRTRPEPRPPMRADLACRGGTRPSTWNDDLMPESWAPDPRKSFDSAAEAYHEIRPNYPWRMFDDLFGLLPTRPRILEVGPGTGQATRDLLDRGGIVHAIEIGPALAAKLREVLPSRELTITVGDFEHVTVPLNSMDAVFSATAAPRQGDHRLHHRRRRRDPVAGTHARRVAHRDPRSSHDRRVERTDRGSEPLREEGETLRARVPQLRAQPTPRATPRRRDHMASATFATTHPNPASPVTRVEPVNA